MALLKAGANAKAKDGKEKTAFDYAKANKMLKGTDALRQLQEASQYGRRNWRPRGYKKPTR